MFVWQKMVLLSLIISLHAANLLAQAPDTMWTRTYGGTTDDRGYSVQQTADGGYIIAGLTYRGFSDVYLIKTDTSGDTLWTRTYGGERSDEGYSVRQTADGGYIVAGYTRSGYNSPDVYLIKTDASGDTLWTRTYGGIGDDRGYSVELTADGGYIVAGVSIGDLYLIKTDGTGDTLWTRTYGGMRTDEGWSVKQTADGAYIVAGYTNSFGAGSSDFYLIKTDTFGDTLWTRTYGGAGYDYSFSVQQTADGGYIVAGRTSSFGAGYDDAYLIKTDASGDSLWTRTYGGERNDGGYSVQQTADGGYIVAGYTRSFGTGGYHDVYLIKTDASGDTLWTRTYGGTSLDFGFSVQQTADGRYVIAGWTYSFGAGGSDVYLIRLDSETGIGDKDNEPMLREFALIRNFPNPFNASTSIRYGLPEQSDVRIEIYNLLGQRVATIYDGLQDAGEHSITWDASGFPSGVYFARLEVGDYSESLKLVLLK